MIGAVAFARGLVMGLAVAAPVGPMSVLCMRRTLVFGARMGLATGAGIALGDTCYALVAALGIAGVMPFVIAYGRPLHLAAGAFLLYLAWRAVFTRSDIVSDTTQPPAAGPFASSLLLTLTNPPTIASFAAIFTALAPADFDRQAALATVAGVGIGSMLWWIALTGVVSSARGIIGARARGWIDRLSGFVLGVLGVTELRRGLEQ